MKRKFAVLFTVLAGCVSLALITGASLFGAPSPLSMRVILDVPYVTGPEADPARHTMDLYLPEGKTNFPLVLFVHSGGLSRGDKAEEGFNHFVNLFLREGIGVASCNYRFSPAVKFPAHVQDVAKAFAWLHRNKAQYQIDGSRIFLVGHSAGAYLSSLLALDRQYLAQESLSPKAIRGVIAISAVYDWVNGTAPGGMMRSRAQTHGTADLKLASPLYYVGADTEVPPFLITYTDHDSYGRSEQGRKFYSRFLQKGLPVELAVITDRLHESQIHEVGQRRPMIEDPGGIAPAQPVLIDDTLGPAMLRFVDDVLRGLPMATALLKSPPASLRTIKDVSYYSGPEADPKFHALDLYLPEGKTNFPLVFYIHGGAWRTGDKADPRLKGFVETFAKIGVGVASVNYRLSPAVKHPAHIQDVAKGFAWLHENASRYGIARNELFLAGSSAGGHLAGLLALDPRYLKKEGLSPSVVKGVLGLNGVYDLPNYAEIGNIPPRREQAFGSDRRAQGEASPIQYAARQAPPFLIVYAENDSFGMREQAINLYAALLREGAKAQLSHIPGRTHSGTLSGMGQQLDGVDDLMAPTAVQFVTRLLASSDGNRRGRLGVAKSAPGPRRTAPATAKPRQNRPFRFT